MKGSRAAIDMASSEATPKVTSDDTVAADPAPEAETIPPVDDDQADPALSEWMLDRSPEQRLEALPGFVDNVWELRGGSKADRLLNRLEK